MGIRLHIFLGFLMLQLTAQARPPEESEFLAADSLGDAIASWVTGLKTVPASVAIFAVHANPPLDEDYAGIVENEIMKSLIRKGIPQVLSCSECRSPSVTVEEDRVVISKGAQDSDFIKNVSKKYPVEAFLVVEIYRTKLSVLSQALLYESPSGVLLSAEQFREPALNISDASVQVLLLVGPGKIIAGKGKGVGLPTAANLMLLEELGFAKGGLNLGFILGSGTSLIFLNPTLAFRGRFGSSSLFWSLQLGVGYGLTGETKGLSFRGGFEFYLGSLTAIGIEATQFLPSETGKTTFGTYLGFNIGLSLGR